MHAHAATPPGPRPIPSDAGYADFLLQPWDPAKPVLIAFKDPFCPYCIAALKRRVELGNYNVFVFWAPILGDQSERRTRELFHCDSPVSEPALRAVIQVARPSCSGAFRQDLYQRNMEMVRTYDPNAVPQYWLGGREVIRASLNLDRSHSDLAGLVDGSRLKIDWARYAMLRVNDAEPDRFNVAVVLPRGQRPGATGWRAMQQDTRFNWLLAAQMDDDDAANLACAGNCDMPAYRYQVAEFRLLNGIRDIPSAQFILEGHVMDPYQAQRLLPAAVVGSLSAAFSGDATAPPVSAPLQ